MKKRYIIFSTLFFCFFFSSIYAQHKADSLKAVLKAAKEDTNKVNTLNALSTLMWETGSYDSSIASANKALKLAGKLAFSYGTAESFSNLGKAYYYQSNYSLALNWTFKALDVEQKLGGKTRIGIDLESIGVIYDEQGNYSQALDYKTRALNILQETGDKMLIAKALGNIGIIYDEVGNYPQALDYDLRALAMEREVGDKRGIAINLGNISNVYNEEGNYPLAIDYNQQSLAINKEIGNKYGIATTLGNLGSNYHSLGKLQLAISYNLQALAIDSITDNKEGMADDYGNSGNVYQEMGNTDKAFDYDEKALAINRGIGNKEGIADVYRGIGEVYTSKKNYTLSKAYLDSSLVLSKKIGDKDNIKAVYISLSQLDSIMGDYKKSLEDYKKSIVYRDSSLNEATIKKTTQAEMNYAFKIKTDSTQLIQDNLNALADKESQRQKTIRNSLALGFSAMFLAAGIFFFQRKRIAKEKKRSDTLLLNILPSEVADELKEKGSAEAKHFDNVTVMFTDFKGFTTIGEKLSPTELVAEINYCFIAYDNIIHKYGIEKIKTIGDAYMAVCGLPQMDYQHAEKVVNACRDIIKFMEEYKEERVKQGLPYFEARVGINTGPVVAGIVGVKKFAYDIWGDTVNIASRMESSGEVGKINISGSTYELVKDTFKCVYRGKVLAKNKGEIDMYFVQS